jgi:hypothetical protein
MRKALRGPVFAVMEFVETSTFTKHVVKTLGEEGNRELQSELLKNPQQGSLIKGTGGARKVRCSAKGKGKSGGSRAIYFHSEPESKCYMLIAFSKSKKSSLTGSQKNALRKTIKRNLK